jgi:arylsulfatase A-like enzyme
MEYLRSPSSPFTDVTVRAIFLPTVPDRNPRRQCGCQPVALSNSLAVAPSGRFSKSRIVAVLLPSRVSFRGLLGSFFLVWPSCPPYAWQAQRSPDVRHAWPFSRPLSRAPQEDIDKYNDRFSEGWDTARERKWQRMTQMGLINCSLAPLEPNMWTNWNTPDAELIAKIGPGEITRAVPWSTLTPEQKKLQRTKMSIHAAMISRMDAETGKILKQVEAMGELDNTLVIFLSDNGASSEQLVRGDGHDSTAALGSARTHLGIGPGWASCSNAPFRLHKSWVNEGGIASPLIVQWPKGIPARNQLRHNPCHFIDFLPTLVDLAGGNAAAPSGPGLAGRSIAPTFNKDHSLTRDFLYFNHNHNRAIREGDMKLIATGDDGPWELYDLSKDRSEQRNLAGAQAKRASQLSARWKAIDDGFSSVRENSQASTKKLMEPGPA